MTNKEVLFNSLGFGDLILAKRLSDTRKIENGHRNGPVLVIGRSKEQLICLYGTSKENKNTLIKILKNNYNLNKDTYITSCIRLISINDFLTSIYHLNEKEKKILTKSLFINGFKNYSFLKEPDIEIGDIIQLNCQHLIIGETSENYVTIKVKYNDTDKIYVFDYKHKNLLPKNYRYKRVAFLSDEEINKVISESKRSYTSKRYGKLEEKSNVETNNALKVGNLIIYKRLLYYLYYELNDKKLSFAVSKNQTPISEKITIGGEVYYANFKLKQDFDENQENIILVSTASEEEKQFIKKKRRSFF